MCRTGISCKWFHWIFPISWAGENKSSSELMGKEHSSLQYCKTSYIHLFFLCNWLSRARQWNVVYSNQNQPWNPASTSGGCWLQGQMQNLGSNSWRVSAWTRKDDVSCVPASRVPALLSLEFVPGVSAGVLVAGRSSINAGGRFKCFALVLHIMLMLSETRSSAVLSVCSWRGKPIFVTKM